MQTVSQAWKDAHKQTLLNESYVEVSLDIADPDSIADAHAEDNGGIHISFSESIVQQEQDSMSALGTLEQNLWLLDGTREGIPDGDYKEDGYIGDVLSNAEGGFDSKIPTITIGFNTVHTKLIPGVTITWGKVYNEYAEHFIVTAYNGDTVVARKEIIENKTVTSIVALDIINYNRITIEVLRWCLPNHRARVDEIFVGWRKVYSKAELFSYSHGQTVDPLSTSLPKMEIKFSVDNSDDSYNPYNLSGLSKYLTERQEVTARYGLKTNDNTIEWIKGGTFYLSEWYAKQNGISADFVARDLLEFMAAHYKDNVTEIQERSLYDLADKVFKDSDLPANSGWVIDESLKNIYTTAPLPDDTKANCLQIIANAGGCVLYPERDGMLYIKSMSNELKDYEINRFNSYSKPEITWSKPIKSIVVKVYHYTVGEKGIESTTTEISSTVGDVGEIITIDNPLITDNERATILAEWIGNYLKNRMTLKMSGRADVRLDALDLVTNENDYGTNTVCMTDVKFEFNGAFRGSGEGRVI